MSRVIAALLKRTTFVVADAEAAARFYREVFGYTVWYDNELPVDGRFPPLAPDGAQAHLVILQVEDPKIGMLGFLSYRDFDPADDRQGSPPRLGLGTPILVMESRELDAVHERAKTAGAHIVTPPVTWQVPGRDGGPPITLRAFSMFDPNGIYLEISAARTTT
jgi:catechol 2,3-dioxygenase-like lactoylglutathione lyase family enzyme